MFDEQIALLGYRKERLLLSNTWPFYTLEGPKFISQWRLIRTEKQKGKKYQGMKVEEDMYILEKISIKLKVEKYG